MRLLIPLFVAVMISGCTTQQPESIASQSPPRSYTPAPLETALKQREADIDREASERSKAVVPERVAYLTCGRNNAARMGLALPNEAPGDIATAAGLRCGIERTALGNKIEQVYADRSQRLRDDLLTISDKGFRDLAVSSVLKVREMKAKPAAPPVAKDTGIDI